MVLNFYLLADQRNIIDFGKTKNKYHKEYFLKLQVCLF